MEQRIHRLIFRLSLSSLFLFAVTAPAQQRPVSNSRAYDVSRETVLQGTVLDYTAASPAPPLGAHVTVQTASGPVDVHLGSGAFLRANQFTLAPGDSVKIVGARVQQRQATVFLARVIQKGSQSLTLRSTRGAPLWLAGARAQAAAGPPIQQGGPR